MIVIFIILGVIISVICCLISFFVEYDDLDIIDDYNGEFDAKDAYIDPIDGHKQEINK